MDALYELEVAFRNLPAGGLPAVHCGWIVPQPAGRYHGKLRIAPSSASTSFFRREGLGLQTWLARTASLRNAARMCRMKLLQMLLVRALVCMFWKTPFEGGLVRWGTTLHDRFMLPDFVKRDLSRVLAHLRQSGFDFEDEVVRFAPRISLSEDWFDHRGRRGTRTAQALEPWNVLAEETVSGRTVRNVDSSLERIQVKLSGFNRGIPLRRSVQWTQCAASIPPANLGLP